jgi:2'-5' RNA ligase
MQSICTVLPEEFAAKVVEARAILAEEPSIGAIYDPPFAHFTLQLAEDYDFEGLAAALEALAAREEPFEARTLGLLLWGASGMDFAVMPHAGQRLRDFQTRVWEAASPFTRGNVRKMDTPGEWIPHVTVKRGGPDRDACLRALSRVMEQTDGFAWTFTVDNIAVQHDPGQNSRTHYQRYLFPLGGSKPAPDLASQAAMNATVQEVREEGGAVTAKGVLDSGAEFEHRWSAAEIVRFMAACNSAEVHFPGARCLVEGGTITRLEPNTPFPIQ